MIDMNDSGSQITYRLEDDEQTLLEEKNLKQRAIHLYFLKVSAQHLGLELPNRYDDYLSCE